MQRILAAIHAHWRSMLATTGETDLQLFLSRQLTITFGACAYLVVILKVLLQGWSPAATAAVIIIRNYSGIAGMKGTPTKAE
ncbi:MAG: hypothetical protein AAFU54_15110 [Chloroflexota bacterium]